MCFDMEMVCMGDGPLISDTCIIVLGYASTVVAVADIVQIFVIIL